ncbi:MAG TPA: hypothetical protein VMR74_14015 [Gammaproteobacteria bacterium]|nr:hypothetical protein [Gammaproteobacteria bacterium]
MALASNRTRPPGRTQTARPSEMRSTMPGISAVDVTSRMRPSQGSASTVA